MQSPESAPDPALEAVRLRRVSLRRAMSDLERALAAPARTPAWPQGVQTAVGELQACMRTHVQATEGPGGFHGDVMSVAPRLAHAVDVSAQEHVTINKLIDEMNASTDADVEAVRDKGTELLARLSRHRQRGADMIFEAYQSDVGGED